MKKKAWHKYFFIVSGCLIALSMLVYLLRHVQVFVVLNGEEEVTVPVFENYIDPGATNRLTGAKLDVEGSYDTTKIGDYQLEYKSFFQNVTRTIHVVDVTPPSVVLYGPDYLQVPMGTQLDTSGVIALDNYDQEVSVKIAEGIQPDRAGDYDVVYTATDSSGNTGVAHQTVRVVEDDYHYEGTVANNVSLIQRRVDRIIAFYNEFYRSIKYLDARDMTGFFGGDGDIYAYKFQKGLDYLIEARKMAPISLYLDDCSFDLTIDRTEYEGDLLCVRVYEDSTLKFHGLEGEESRQHHILSKFYFDYDGELVQVYHEEGFYLYFDDEELVLGDDYKSVLDQRYEDLLQTYAEQMALSDEARGDVNLGVAQPAQKTAGVAYDRDAAIAYADQFSLSRSWNYPDYESNCMNYVSQVLHAGGIPIDHTGSNQWKNYSLTEDHSDAAQGFVYSFIRISYFQKYLEDTADPPKMVVEQGMNFWLGEEGDIIYVSSEGGTYDDCPHVVILRKVVRNGNGEIVDFLVNGNTNDQKNFPLCANGYPYRLLAKVHGYNQ